MEIRVTGNEEELKNFTTLLQLIQSFGRYGMSRQIAVHVDGDGSGRLDFEIIKSDGDRTEFPSFEHKELQKLDETTHTQYSVYIGE